jgi:hypothetical protein
MALGKVKNTIFKTKKIIIVLVLILLVTAQAFNFGHELKKIGNAAKNGADNIKDKAKEVGEKAKEVEEKAKDTTAGLKDKVNEKVVKNIMNTVDIVEDKVVEELSKIKNGASKEEIEKKRDEIIKKIAEKSVQDLKLKLKEDLQKAFASSILNETECKLISIITVIIYAVFVNCILLK